MSGSSVTTHKGWISSVVIVLLNALVVVVVERLFVDSAPNTLEEDASHLRVLTHSPLRLSTDDHDLSFFPNHTSSPYPSPGATLIYLSRMIFSFLPFRILTSFFICLWFVFNLNWHRNITFHRLCANFLTISSWITVHKSVINAWTELVITRSFLYL